MRIVATAKIVVRVMNDPKNKRTFKKFRIGQFPVMGVAETTQKFVETYAEHLGFSDAAKAEIGYVGYSNQKLKVVSDNDLEIALGSGGFHKDNIPVLYICRKEERAGKRTVPNVEGERIFICRISHLFNNAIFCMLPSPSTWDDF